MAKRAKRAARPNPRTDRNFLPPFITNDNVIEVDNFKRKRKRVDIIPRSIAQETYLDALDDENKAIVFGIGPAGTGKTMLATQWAIREFNAGTFDKIVISRPNVAVDDRDIGFLPGGIYEKMAPWAVPILDVFKEIYSVKEVTKLLEEELLEIVPIAFIRGRTLKNACVIIDEAQGTTPNSMLSILTRIGDGSKMVVTGDLEQSDIGSRNGLSDFLDRWDGSSGRIDVVRFSQQDVQRHAVIADLLNIYKK